MAWKAECDGFRDNDHNLVGSAKSDSMVAATGDSMTTPTVDQWLDAVADRARVGAPSDDLEALLVKTAVELERGALEDASVQATRILRILLERLQDRAGEEQATVDLH